MARFEANVEAFRYTPIADTPANTLVQVGALLGITRDSCPAGGTVMAFMTGQSSVYSLPLATGLAANVDRGTLATVNESGKIAPATAGDYIVGIFWEAAATTDAEALILLAGYSVVYGTPVATASTAGLVKPDGETIEIDENGVISVVTPVENGGGGDG